MATSTPGPDLHTPLAVTTRKDIGGDYIWATINALAFLELEKKGYRQFPLLLV